MGFSPETRVPFGAAWLEAIIDYPMRNSANHPDGESVVNAYTPIGYLTILVDGESGPCHKFA